MYFEGDGRLKLIHQISTYFALAPPYRCKNNSKKIIIYQFYSIVTAIFHLLLYTATMYTKYLTMSLPIKVIPTAIDFFTCTFEELTTIDAVIASAFYNINDFDELVSYFDDVDMYLKVNKKNKDKYFRLLLIGFHAILIALVIQGFNFWNGIVGLKLTFLAHCFKFVQCYNGFLSMLLMFNYLLIILRQFKLLNRTLKHTRLHKMEVSNLTKVYFEINKIIQIFNGIFGWRLFCFSGAILLRMLGSANLISGYVFTPGQSGHNDIRDKAIYVSLFWTIIILVSIKQETNKF